MVVKTAFLSPDFDQRSSPSLYKSLFTSSDLELNKITHAPKTLFVWVRLRAKALRGDLFIFFPYLSVLHSQCDFENGSWVLLFSTITALNSASAVFPIAESLMVMCGSKKEHRLAFVKIKTV